MRTLADLPAATAHLSALLTARGPAVTVAEVRAASRALLDGTDLTARVLTGNAHPVAGNPAEAARHLTAALPHLQRLLHAQVATLTPPAPAVLLLAQQIRDRLAAAAGLTRRLERDRQTGGPADGLARVGTALARWAAETGPAAAPSGTACTPQPRPAGCSRRAPTPPAAAAPRCSGCRSPPPRTAHTRSLPPPRTARPR